MAYLCQIFVLMYILLLCCHLFEHSFQDRPGFKMSSCFLSLTFPTLGAQSTADGFIRGFSDGQE